jgi:hypothetical protein
MVVVTVISLLYSLFPSSFSALILMVYAVSGDRFLTTTEFDDPGLDDMNMVFPSIQFSDQTDISKKREREREIRHEQNDGKQEENR